MTPRKLAIVALAIAGLAVAALLAWWLWPAPEPVADRLVLEPAAFNELNSWAGDDHAQALAAFVQGCPKTVLRAAKQPFTLDTLTVTEAHWQTACDAALAVPPGDNATARAFFERTFRPYAVSNNGERDGLFTGYYEAELSGAVAADSRYSVPLYRRPDDLVLVSLGQFRADLKGRRIAGRVVDGKLVPFDDRTAIDGGSLGGKGLELAWVDDPVDAFFLHIQGSGRVRMADGSILRVGYDGHNGHPYFAIGRELIRRGAMTKETVSMQAIRRWLADNPAEARTVMAMNASYIFFRPLAGDGPIGALGVALTPERSLAIDKTHLPLGAPLWLETSLPSPGKTPAFRQLMIAQDTGGAIRGPVRGDVFFGFGKTAADIAGRMKQPGRYWILLPRVAGPGS